LLKSIKPKFTLHIGYIYEAADKVLKKNVALKIEKKDKNKSILIFEYNVLQTLKGKYCEAYPVSEFTIEFSSSLLLYR
jgi:hypothetical protein